MPPVLIVLVCVPSAVAAGLAWWALRARMRHARSLETARAHEACALATINGLIEASRESSDAVLRRLDRTLREQDASIDAFLAFVPRGEELQCVYASGARSDHFEACRLAREANENLPARAAANGHRATLAERVPALIPTDRQALAVPLLDLNGLRAVAYVSSSSADRAIDEDEVVRTIERASAAYALAYEREADRIDATYDGLTGLLTPRAFRAHLHRETSRSRNGAGPMLSLWFIDTDHFKQVNDRFGHAAGDLVLQRMAELLRNHTCAPIDVAARNGGDEFCALIREAQKTLSIERAQAFCKAVRERDFGIAVPITTSIGVATFPYDARTSNELLEVADAAMYHSKRLGRDRVSFPVDASNFAVIR